MSARTAGALLRWHLGQLGTLDAFAAVTLGLMLGIVSGWAALAEPLAALYVTCVGSIFAIAFASSPKATRATRSLFLFSAPLYGRELARGLAIAPTLLAMLFPLAGWAGWSLLRETHVSIWILPLVCAMLAALIALSATLRDGWRAVLYRILAFCTAAALTGCALFATTDAAHTALAFAALFLGFFALRAFGETLARYDPLDEA